MRGLTLEKVWGGRPHLRAANQTSHPRELACAAFSSALAVCGSYASKAPLFLIRPHIYGKLSEAQTLEELVLRKLRAFASSYWNLQVSNQLVGLQCTCTGAFSRISHVFLELGPHPFFSSSHPLIAKIKLSVIRKEIER